jgi:hypothetical protein
MELARKSSQNLHNKGLRHHNPENKGLSWGRRAMKLGAALLREQDRRLELWMTRSDVTIAEFFFETLREAKGGSRECLRNWVDHPALFGMTNPVAQAAPSPTLAKNARMGHPLWD